VKGWLGRAEKLGVVSVPCRRRHHQSCLSVDLSDSK